MRRSAVDRRPPALMTPARAVRPERRLVAALRPHGTIAAVLALFAASAFVVPTMAPVAVGDDWVYARSVEILVRQHLLKVLDLAVVTLVFQVVWGALFAHFFGLTFGAMRLSTVVLVGLGGLACYGLCRELGVSRTRSAFGAASYLFNPLLYVLGFTFMTDAPFTALLTIATCFYARGLRPDQPRPLATWAGSGAAALAFLTRQEGALIPFAVVVSLLVSRRLRPDRRGVALLRPVVALPAAAMILYYLWLRFVNGIPVQQQSFVASVRKAGWGGAWQLTCWLVFIAAMYVGLFAVPLLPLALARLPRLIRSIPPLGWVAVCAWEALLLGGAVAHAQPGSWPAGTRMPYVPQYLNPWQLGAPDIRGGRAWMIANRGILDWATILCAAASLALVFALARQFGSPPRADHATAGLVLTIGLGQVVGLLPPSFHFRTWAVSMDRYFLPLLPFAVCLGLWALRDLWLPLPLGWFVAAAFALFAVAGTRDFLVFQEATWDMARAANARGVPNVHLDAGAAWDGYHLWDYSNARHIGPQTPSSPLAPRPWWTSLFAPATDSRYVVATRPLLGYDVVEARAYSAWLAPQPNDLYLLRRWDVAGPP